MRSAVWWTVSIISFVVAVASFVKWLALKEWLDSADKASSVVSGFVGVTSLAVAAVSLVVAVRSGRADPMSQLNEAVEELARLVDRQCAREAGIRGLLHPEPLRVKWRSTTRPVSPTAAEILDSTQGSTPKRLRLADEIRNVASTWEQLPSRQLVVIGAPGAGKSTLAMLLVRQIIARREPGKSVPVLLNLMGWDPERIHLDIWLAERLAADYPQLNAKRHYGARAAQRLVDRRLVIPVLDGLDEMPESARPKAVVALTEVVGGERPLVLTCRAEEYEAAVQSVGAPLARAAVVELQPVSGAEIAAYLTTGLVAGDLRWAGVLERLRNEPDGELATALSTPLMAYLARIAYRDPGADPGALLGITDVEQTLLAAYLPMMYRSVSGMPKLGKYRPDQAQRWLGALAQQMERRGDGSLRLWSIRSIQGLPAARLARVAVLLSVTLTSLLIAPAILFGLRDSLLLYIAGILSFMAASLDLSWAPRLFRRSSTVVPFRIDPNIVGIAPGVIAGFMASQLSTAAFLLQIISLDFKSPDEQTMMSLANSAAPFTVITLTAGLLCGSLVSAAPRGQSFEPSSALKRDLFAWCLIVTISTVSAVVMRLARNEFDWLMSICTGSGTGIIIAAALGVGTATILWGFVYAVLLVAGVVPIRATAFIEDAHRRGVLRVVGMEYQFRHAKIQTHLASLQRTP